MNNKGKKKVDSPVPREINIVGAGGVAKHALPALLSTVKHYGNPGTRIFIYDGDSYEENNFDRQLHDPQFVGENKAVVMEKLYGEYCLNRDFGVPVKLEAVPQWFTDASPTKENSAIFMFADNNAAVMYALTRIDNFGGYGIRGANELLGSQAWFYDPRMSETWLDPRVRFPEIADPKANAVEDPVARAACNSPEALERHPQLACANLGAASFVNGIAWQRWSQDPLVEDLVKDKVDTIQIDSNDLGIHTTLTRGTMLEIGREQAA
jgi:hypothetical protein